MLKKAKLAPDFKVHFSELVNPTPAALEYVLEDDDLPDPHQVVKQMSSDEFADAEMDNLMQQLSDYAVRGPSKKRSRSNQSTPESAKRYRGGISSTEVRLYFKWQD